MPATPNPSPGQRPRKQIIDTSVDDLPLKTAEAWQAIEEQNNPPTLFVYGGGVVRARYDYHDDTLILDPINTDIMRHELAEMAVWVKANGTKSSPPMKVVRNVIASRVIALPKLQRTVSVPVFAPNGSLQTTPGYNPDAYLIYAPPRGFTALDVPDKVTQGHVDDAKKLIEELIQDFPFASDNAGDSPDHDNAIGLMLLPFVREMINGPTPLHLIEASMEGSGKGLLVKSLLYPGLGDIYGAPQPENDTELKKLLTAKIRAFSPLIYIDNVSRPISSGEFAAALTMDIWDDRILGESKTTNAQIRALWVMTGNNVAMSREITRRTLRVRLTPQTDRPEERQDFQHPDQVEWYTDNRPQLIWACHVICKWAIQQRLPRMRVKTIGTYERFCRIMGSILECAGYNHFLCNYREVQAGSNSERDALALFAMTWYEWLERQKGSLLANGKDPIDTATTTDLWGLVKNIEGLPIQGRDEQGKIKSLGKWLKSKHEVIVEYVDEDPTNPIGSYKFKILNRGQGKGDQRGSNVWGIEIFETTPRP